MTDDGKWYVGKYIKTFGFQRNIKSSQEEREKKNKIELVGKNILRKTSSNCFIVEKFLEVLNILGSIYLESIFSRLTRKEKYVAFCWRS